MNNIGTFTKLSPLGLLRQLINAGESTCLRAISNSVSWSIYLEQGKIIYATHSLEPFERLDRHVRRLSQTIPALSLELRVQLRLKFEPDLTNNLSLEPSNRGEQPPEYQAISWLMNEEYLQGTQAAKLIQDLVREVIESFLLVSEGNYELVVAANSLPVICQLDGEETLTHCQARLKAWQSLSPHISSPDQRPYLFIKSICADKNFPGREQNLSDWMKGFSLRHLAVIMNQDEVKLATDLHPFIVKGAVMLHEPDPPFDLLPKTFIDKPKLPIYSQIVVNRELVNAAQVSEETAPVADRIEQVENLVIQPPIPEPPLEQIAIEDSTESKPETVTTTTIPTKKAYKIVAVDDSPTILKEISRCLEDENVAVVTINDPVKAVMSIIRHKPDLILLDLNMAGIDGYELCRIIRNNSTFKSVPIIFVTSNKGIVDKVKAKIVGASGYLTKPFKREDLLKIIFMNLE
ncbi:response regulator receiver protein [Richelia sinica FACHB-800]|uniref:Response regulator receiver protein n=1 Tax=Richelia sinica FACHB-800 TaxID=1357546 RepID=A0A975T7H1_9NOST|nr:response regulator [Richelia sinica]MBD2665796.1 response regulator [Richelia sinica FACHB-800]QXE23613.1 response regulator receiver protein [Richelia sinica FACHB-800]